ncbi:MAG: hypothetical protein ABSG37_09005 [Candidatus Limnocylindrales bacterium]
MPAISALLGAAVLTGLVTGCGSTVKTAGAAQSARPTGSPAAAVASPSGAPLAVASGPAVASGSAGASGPAVASGSAGASGSPVPSPTGGFSCGPHLDAGLEDLLPSTIGGVDLEKCSLALSAYIASTTGGDGALYTPWLVKFGKTPGDVTMAVAVDLTGQENFIIHAIQVPGVADATLSSSFADVARKAGWPVGTTTIGTQTYLVMIDPAAETSGALSVGYVFAKNGVLYEIITDNSSLRIEAMAKLP